MRSEEFKKIKIGKQKHAVKVILDLILGSKGGILGISRLKEQLILCHYFTCFLFTQVLFYVRRRNSSPIFVCRSLTVFLI